jgi:hypothetical protein
MIPSPQPSGISYTQPVAEDPLLLVPVLLVSLDEVASGAVLCAAEVGAVVVVVSASLADIGSPPQTQEARPRAKAISVWREGRRTRFQR